MVRFQFKRLLQCTIYNQKKEMKKSRLYYFFNNYDFY